MPTFPKWIPIELNGYANKLIDTGNLGLREALLIRLLTYHDMQSVWKLLSSHADSIQQLIDFLEFVQLHSAILSKVENIDISSKAVQRNAYTKIQKSIKAIIKELANLGSSNNPEVGWALLESALERSECEFPENYQDIVTLRSYLQELQNETSAIEVLEAIQSAAELAANAPAPNLPVRRNTQRAKINWLIQDLSQYCQNHFGEYLDEVVANTVNTVFDLVDSDIEADYVAKLRKQKQRR